MSIDRANLRHEIQSELAELETNLHRAVERCEKKYGIPATQLFQRLTELKALRPNAWEDDDGRLMLRILDPDTLALLLRVQQKNRLDKIGNSLWKDLTKREKRAAPKLGGFFGSNRSFPRQRPTKIDVKLALYLIFVIEKIIGRRFPFSRSATGDHDPPRGPAFDALLAALALAQRQAELSAGATKKPAPNRTALENIVKIVRTRIFDNLLESQGFDRSSSGILANGDTIALTISLARKRLHANLKEVPTNTNFFK